MEIGAEEMRSVAGIIGSLSSTSLNRRLFNEATTRGLRLGLSIHEVDISALPMFNVDLEADPAPGIRRFQRAIHDADALLVVTPEHNFNVPAVLKNALDWASRPPLRVLAGKPAAIMGASIGAVGTARAQLALRQSFIYTQTPCMPGPEFLLGHADTKFDDSGVLIDDPMVTSLTDFLSRFRRWINGFTTGE